jgi:topoisomerase-4 subunit A
VQSATASFSTGDEILLDIETLNPELDLPVEKDQIGDLPVPAKTPKKQLNLF